MTGRRKILREDAWSSLAPHQKGLLIGLGIGTALWAFTGTLPWIAAGVGLGSGLGLLLGRRRARTQHPPLGVPMTSPPRRKPMPRVLTEEERESSLYAAAWFNGTRMAEGKTDRAGALQHMRETIGGFPPERYETQLDATLAGIEEAKVRVSDRRAKDVAKARELDLLNAVFDLHYFNRRFSGRVGEYGLGPIDLVGALGDLWSREQIDEAVTRSDALIDEGIRMGVGSWDHEPNMARLRAAHPGFSERSLSRALDWGHIVHR